MAQQVVFLTGASSGIGKDTAKMLHNAGYKVYAAARRIERYAGFAGYGDLRGIC